MPTEKPEGKGVEEGKSGGDGAGGGKTVPAADHPAARATTAGDGAAAIQVGAFDDSGGKEVAYDPISKVRSSICGFSTWLPCCHCVGRVEWAADR